MSTTSYYGLYGPRSPIISVTSTDRKRIKGICYYVIAQSIVVISGACTVFGCVWDPHKGYFELEILARMMYLYDTDECGYKQPDTVKTVDVVLSRETYGLPVKPIKHSPAVVSVLSKLSAKTWTCLIFSCVFHALWMASAIFLLIMLNIAETDVIKTALKIFNIICALMVFFDCCMAVVYITHIQQSLTRAMIIRYSGYVQMPGVKASNDFGGWVPMIASALWLRGGVFLALNIYCYVLTRRMIRRIAKREVRSRLSMNTNVPFPESEAYKNLEVHSLYFKANGKKADRHNSIFT